MLMDATYLHETTLTLYLIGIQQTKMISFFPLLIMNDDHSLARYLPTYLLPTKTREFFLYRTMSARLARMTLGT